MLVVVSLLTQCDNKEH